MSEAIIQSDPTLTGEPLVLETDVLVLGGGPSGAWAATTAASHGARVILADKGYCGTSGATAPSGTGIWHIPPDPEKRAEAKASREGMGGYLADHGWMDRVLERTWENVNRLAEWGYPFPQAPDGDQMGRGGVQGPEYMRLMRKLVKKAGVKILDQSPALELLVDQDGSVAGAAGVQRQENRAWTVKARAVVIATGGCAFLSKALGCNVLTGDGGLMSAEAGAVFSGMEFSNAYAISPAFGSVTKTAFYKWATFFYEDGRVIEGAGSQRGRSVIARTLLTEPVYCQLDKVDTDEMKEAMRIRQPNFFLPFDRVGVNPFTDRFPVTLRLEGTVRGTGGIRLADEGCSTGVPGLYAAGDAATREYICGGFTGGGSHNAAWAISSGYWAGQSAAGHARTLGTRAADRRLRGLGRAALRPDTEAAPAFNPEEVIRAVQAEVHPYDKNLFRTDKGLVASLSRLEQLWQTVQAHADGPGFSVRAREAAAMVATARWMYTSARARTETRGMHKHMDYRELDPAQQRRLVSGGLDTVWVRPEEATANTAPAVREVIHT